jgi:hypothetical protein
MLSPDIPVFIQRALQHGVCAMLPTGDGWQVWPEPGACPGCQRMRALYIVRQGRDMTWRSGCVECDDATTEQLMRATARLFEVLP